MKLHSLQIVRAMAANLVVISHCDSVLTKHFGGPVLPHVAVYGISGVDFFFVLSGFIMVDAADRSSAGRFLWDRVTRIYPAYWVVSAVVLVAMLIIPGLVNSSYAEPTSVWKSFLLVPQAQPPLLNVGWTLIYEMYFYLVMTAIIALRAPLFLSLVAWGVVLLASRHLALGPIANVATNPFCFEFLLGVAVARLAPRSWKFGAVAVVVGATAFCGSIAYQISINDEVINYGGWMRVGWFALPAALVIYGFVAVERGGIRFPAMLSKIGDWSYSTYLLHILVVSALGYAVAGMTPWIAGLVLVSVGLVASNALGFVSFRLIEQPAMSLRKIKLRPAEKTA